MDDELDLAAYLEAAKDHWPWALLAFATIIGITLAYAFLAPPVYEAKSIIHLTTQDQESYFLLGSYAPRAADLETQKVIIQGPQVLYPIYEQHGEDFKLTVTTIKNSDLIEIAVRAGSADEAALIANHITNQYISHLGASRFKGAESTIAFIDERIDAYEEEMNLLDLELTFYENANTSEMTRKDQLAYELLQHEMAAKTKIYGNLLVKKEEAKLSASIDSTNAQIIAHPEPPLTPIRPNKPLVITLGVIIAAIAGVAAAGIADDGKKRRR